MSWIARNVQPMPSNRVTSVCLLCSAPRRQAERELAGCVVHTRGGSKKVRRFYQLL